MMDRKEGKRTSAYLDRFEGDFAVLYIEDTVGKTRKVNLPRECVPDSVSDGDYLTLSVSFDAEKTKQAEEEALSLLDDDEEKEDGNA